MSDDVQNETTEPVKKKATRKKAASKTASKSEPKSNTRYFAFFRPNASFAVPNAFGTGSKVVNVNKQNVVAAVDDPVLAQVIETASKQSNGNRMYQNSEIKEVAGDLSAGEKNLIGTGVDFNLQAFRKAFNGLERI